MGNIGVQRSGNLNMGLLKYPKKATPQQYERFLKKEIENIKFERDMWNLYCQWGAEANFISLSARVRVITLTQILGDGKDYAEKIMQQTKQFEKRQKK